MCCSGRPKSFYSKGCKRNFNWDTAARYTPRAAFRLVGKEACLRVLRVTVYADGYHVALRHIGKYLQAKRVSNFGISTTQ